MTDITEEQRAIVNAAQQFSQEELAPNAKHWDEEQIFPIDKLKEAAALGFAGIYVNAENGGIGLTRLDATLIFEELSSACVSTAAYLSIHNMVAWMINYYGNAQQIKTWLPSLLNMERLSSYCLTEPTAGSDAGSLKTTAVRKGDEYVINGSKSFISGGPVDGLCVVMARTGDAGPKGISAFIVPKETKGVTFGKKEVKLGWNSQPTSMVFFDNVHISAENLLGQEGEGFKIALSGLNGGRINIAACSLGGARACLTYARNYLTERQQFGKKLAEFQALQFKLADMATELDAARLMVHRGARAIDNNHPETAMYCAMAKRFATDAGFSVCNDALQLYGGYGYLREYPIERYFRDLRVHQILEGTNEIMRMIIARRILQEDFTF